MILTREQLVVRCGQLRSEGGRIVLTNGCFDILHAGHVAYLQQAAGFGDALVVALNGDDSVRRLKGPFRPLVPEQDRAAVIDALRCVDMVSMFGEDTPLELIRAVMPDVLVKGGDYDPGVAGGPRAIVGADLVRARGGEVRVVPLLRGRSTTDIVTRVLQVYGIKP